LWLNYTQYLDQLLHCSYLIFRSFSSIKSTPFLLFWKKSLKLAFFNIFIYPRLSRSIEVIHAVEFSLYYFLSYISFSLDIYSLLCWMLFYFVVLRFDAVFFSYYFNLRRTFSKNFCSAALLKGKIGLLVIFGCSILLGLKEVLRGWLKGSTSTISS
jgi:hypothetical protein